jgi:tetratricopeptide (TPR) repeat protein
MAKVCAILFLFVFFLSPLAFSQSHPAVELQLLSNEQIAELNLDKPSFSAWVKIMGQRIDSIFSLTDQKRDIMVLVHMYADRDPTLQFYSRPAYSTGELKKVQTAFHTVPPFRTRFIAYDYLYLIRTNGGSGDHKGAFSPEYVDPLNLSHKAFTKASLTEKKVLLSTWAQEVMPLLAASLQKVDDKFSGVKYMARTLNTLTAATPVSEANGASQSRILALTDSMADYWRGVMEMSPGNGIISLSKVMLLVKDGDFDLAKEYCELLRPFGNDKLAATWFLTELSWQLDAFNKELQTRSARGLEQGERGNYAGAVSIFSGLLAEYPRSAALHYDLNYELLKKRQAEHSDSVFSPAQWASLVEVINSCNPLYPQSIRPSSPKQAYIAMRRAMLPTLFKDKTKYPADVLELADIALDLGAYGYAAEAYWLCFSRLKKEEIGHRETLAYFLYCLDKLGVKEIRKNFIWEFEKEFKKIDKERKGKMEESAAYKGFKSH